MPARVKELKARMKEITMTGRYMVTRTFQREGRKEVGGEVGGETYI